MRYQSLLEAYKQELKKNLNLRFTEFCRNNGVNNTSFRHWMERRGITVSSVCREVRRSLGVHELKVAPKYEGLKPNDLYSAVWNDFKTALLEDCSLRLSVFCRSCGVKVTRMEKWLRRQNLSVIDAKMEAEQNNRDLILMNETLRKRFRHVLNKYRDLLLYSPGLSIREHCANMHTDLRQFQRWMRLNGITVDMIRKAAKTQAYFAADNRRVQIQFTPNGRSFTDRLHSVAIRLPDGLCVMMDDCNVVDLCAFVVAYSESSSRQKNK